MLLFLSIAARADALDWSVVPLEAVVPRPDAEGDAPLVQAAVSRVSAEIQPGLESRLTLTYTIQVFADGFSVAELGAGPLTVESARLDGRAVAVPPERDGSRRLVAELDRGTHTVVLAGVMATPRSTLSLPMPTAPIAVRLAGTGLDVSIDRGAVLSEGRIVVPPGDALAVTWKTAAPPAPRPSRLEAAAAVGLTLSTDGMEGAGVVTFDAIHGAVEQVRIAVPGADWAEASGGVVASSTLSGEWLEVGLVAPQTGRFSVEVALRGPAAAGRTDAPLLLPQADSREGWVSIYQGEEGYLARDTTDLVVIAPGVVPPWGRDLASGQLLSSLQYTTGQPSLRWEQSEWEALQTPGTVIDSARLEVAVVAHGRALTRARYQVRNDRGAWLWMDLPDASSILAVRVAGHIVEPVVSEGRLGIPLEKSVETLAGLVSFPVEVSLLASAPKFSRRGAVVLTAPAVSAPITDVSWSLSLPPGTIPRRTEGNVQVAADSVADRVLLIGRGYRRAPSLEPVLSSGSRKTDTQSVEASQDYWNQAYDAYKNNRFDEAGELLEQSLIYNPDNVAASALQGNVMVLTGESGVGGDDEVEQVERVKAMARAKSKGESQRQQILVEDAEEQLRAGNVEEAITLYESAIVVTDQLARLESDEAYVQKAAAESLRSRLAEAEGVSRRNRRQEQAERAGGRSDRNGIEGAAADEPEPVPAVLSPSVQKELRTDGALSAALPPPSQVSDERALNAPLRVPLDRAEPAAMVLSGTLSGAVAELKVSDVGASADSLIRNADASEMIMVESTASPRRSGRGASSRRSAGAPSASASVQTVSAFNAPTGVTASRWIVLVPSAGPVLELTRQLVPAGEALEVVVPYRIARSGRPGG
ncbi:MAG: hypothetical protein P8R54_06905 [Myxococcota bacterium]|nr:hypothetical protein [Myxococcota bacterium]